MGALKFKDHFATRFERQKGLEKGGKNTYVIDSLLTGPSEQLVLGFVWEGEMIEDGVCRCLTAVEDIHLVTPAGVIEG